MPLKDFLKVLDILSQHFKSWNSPVESFQAISSKDPYKLLISTLLSLRTKDEVTSKAVQKLFLKAPNIYAMVKLSSQAIQDLIYPVGFYRNKSLLILEISHRILKEFQGQVPNNLKDLLSFKGVGLKTANLVLAQGFGIPAICVDVHVHRISNRLGFIKTKNPDETEKTLSKKVPKDYWNQINTLLVGFGQVLCKPVSPFCSSCPVAYLCSKMGVEKHR